LCGKAPAFFALNGVSAPVSEPFSSHERVVTVTASMAKARIMVVEDEGIIAEHIATSLRDMDYDICGMVTTGEDALKLAEETHPDLVLMDVVLQGEMDGIAAADAIRERFRIPIVYLTAYADDGILERARRTEPFGYLIKPFRERELYSTIKMALAKHRLHVKLRESQEWLSVTLRSIGDAVIATDREGRVMFMNPVAESLTGFTQSEAERRPLDEVFKCVDGGAAHLTGCCQPENGGDGDPACESSCCTIVPRNCDQPCDVETSIAPIRNLEGQAIGAVLVFRDITERKRSEERLSLLSEAVEQSSEGIAVLDLSGCTVFVNRAFASLHGFTREELQGCHVSVFHNEEQMEAVNAVHQQILTVGQYSGELWQARKDGSVFPALVHNSVLRDQDGNKVGFIGTLRDISDLKATEAALRASHEALAHYSATLEAKVEERTRDLEQSRRELEKRSESLEKGNKALRIVIEAIDEQKKHVEHKISENVSLTVMPILEQLKVQDVSETVRFLLQSLEFNLANLFSSFGISLVKDGNPLTPRETRICEMIRAGLSSKHIAKVMEISPQTVLVHRKNIRRKLGMSKSGRNLASFLKTKV
jgi:PAS domain S-box-containing protein